MKGSVFPRAPAAVPGVDCTAEISAQTGVISFSLSSWFAGAQVRKKKPLCRVIVNKYYTDRETSGRPWLVQTYISTAAAVEINAKKEREICIWTIKTKQKNKSQITKKLKEKIKAKVFCRWVLCFSVFSQSIMKTIEVDEVSCIAFRYGTNFAIHSISILYFVISFSFKGVVEIVCLNSWWLLMDVGGFSIEKTRRNEIFNQLFCVLGVVFLFF